MYGLPKKPNGKSLKSFEIELLHKIREAETQNKQK